MLAIMSTLLFMLTLMKTVACILIGTMCLHSCSIDEDISTETSMKKLIKHIHVYGVNDVDIDEEIDIDEDTHEY